MSLPKRSEKAPTSSENRRAYGKINALHLSYGVYGLNKTGIYRLILLTNSWLILF
jgi:hypothetical protein